MSIIILLIFISISIAFIFLLIFYWSMKSGQYDDTYTPSVRMLFEDKTKKKSDVKEEATKS
ncbi:MAG: cbb3-type cytochrome oxidase assembly protein CcoS [Cyclobacteriaceae bacterium]|nr:cbb3-type cytochrome oxidase assembly protein CcoS [Cyclobacteriaceae bacterium]UYN87937.1 MAG: cbb3-type cytochrome oxidase assembly protein CcoS [Cyclobacteriaceae bacterium]